MKLRYFFGFSLLAHVSLYFWLSQSESPQEESPQVVQVSFVRAPQKIETARRGTGLKLNLGLKLSGNGNFQNSNLGESRDREWVQASHYLSDSISQYEGLNQRQISYLKSLWTEINDSLQNPQYLSEYGIVGDVYLKFKVDASGNLIGDSLRASAENRVLKVLAARAIRKSVRSDHPDLKYTAESFEVEALFRWTDQTPCRSFEGMNKSRFSFCRVSKSEKKSFSKGEKVLTYLSALQYGTGAGEAIKKYNQQENRRKTKFNPFEELARDPDWNLGG